MDHKYDYFNRILNPDWDAHKSASNDVANKDGTPTETSSKLDKELVLGFDSILWGALFVAMFTGQMWCVIAVKVAFGIYTVVVLRFAARIDREIPSTFPGQRFIGMAFYVSAHGLMFLPGQLPLPFVAFVLLGTPIGIFLLFE